MQVLIVHSHKAQRAAKSRDASFISQRCNKCAPKVNADDEDEDEDDANAINVGRNTRNDSLACALAALRVCVCVCHCVCFSVLARQLTVARLGLGSVMQLNELTL